MSIEAMDAVTELLDVLNADMQDIAAAVRELTDYNGTLGLNGIIENLAEAAGYGVEGLENATDTPDFKLTMVAEIIRRKLNLTDKLSLSDMAALIPYCKGNAVARIGIRHYTTLKDAVEDAKDGDTITLLADATVTKQLEITKTITIDGKTLKVDDNGEYINCKVTSNTTHVLFNVQGADDVKFTLQNVDVYHTANLSEYSLLYAAYQSGIRLKVSNCKLYARNNIAVFMRNCYNDSKLEIENSTIASGYRAIQINSQKVEVDVNKSNVVSSPHNPASVGLGTAFYLYDYSGKINVTDSFISATSYVFDNTSSKSTTNIVNSKLGYRFPHLIPNGWGYVSPSKDAFWHFGTYYSTLNLLGTTEIVEHGNITDIQGCLTVNFGTPVTSTDEEIPYTSEQCVRKYTSNKTVYHRFYDTVETAVNYLEDGDTLFTYSSAMLKDLPKYYSAQRVYDRNGTAYYNIIRLPVPAKPTVTCEPSETHEGMPFIRVTTSEVVYALKYRITGRMDFERVIEEDANGFTSFGTNYILGTNGTYYFSFAAANKFGEYGEYSDPVEFTVDTAEDPPEPPLVLINADDSLTLDPDYGSKKGVVYANDTLIWSHEADPFFTSVIFYNLAQRMRYKNLQDGTYAITAKTTNNLGYWSDLCEPVEYTLDENSGGNTGGSDNPTIEREYLFQDEHFDGARYDLPAPIEGASHALIVDGKARASASPYRDNEGNLILTFQWSNEESGGIEFFGYTRGGAWDFLGGETNSGTVSVSIRSLPTPTLSIDGNILTITSFGANRYRIYIDNVERMTIFTTTLDLSTLDLKDGEHNIRAIAVSEGGVSSEISSPVTYVVETAGGDTVAAGVYEYGSDFTKLLYTWDELVALPLDWYAAYCLDYSDNRVNMGQIVGDLAIPEGVEYIGDLNCANIIIPSTVKTIFYLCDIGISSQAPTAGECMEIMYIKATEPPSVDGFPYEWVNLKKIVVPKGCVEVYKSATWWCDFAEIIVEADE